MIAGLPLGFAQPLVLLGLLSLPVLWWLLRLIPPQPRRIAFPPTRLLFDIAPREETPQRTPWWLTLLRLTLAALVIIAAAGPLWNPPVATSTAKAPLALLIDDGFPAAGTWDARMRTAEDLIARAEADQRGVALIPLSEPARDISFETPAAAMITSAASVRRSSVSHHGVRCGVSSRGAMSNRSRVGGNAMRRGCGGMRRSSHHSTGRLKSPSRTSGWAKPSGSPAIMPASALARRRSDGR